jgi:protein-tyrosine phosphatase
MMVPRLKRWMARGAAPGAAGNDTRLAVLMVCMGNICRSPTAQGVLRAKLQAAGLGGLVSVDSAGTINTHAGEPPDPRAIQQAARRGYDISGLRARQVCDADFSRFQWVLAMDEDNLRWLSKRLPAAGTPRLGLLMAHAGRHPGVTEVPDPYYGAAAGFEHVLTLVEDACDGFVALLQAEFATSAGSAVKLD